MRLGSVRRIGSPSRLSREPDTSVRFSARIFEKLRDLLGRMLEIGIHDEDVLAAAVLEARVDRNSLADVPGQQHRPKPRVRLGQRPEHGVGAVGRTVGDGDDLGRMPEDLEHRIDPADELLDAGPLVAHGRDDGEDRDGNFGRHAKG